MRIRVKSLVLLLLVGVVLMACAPFVMTTNSLKGAIVTFHGGSGVSPNGHDTSILTFDSTGKAGTFENQLFTYGFATQAAVTSGKYTDMSWFQDGGMTGSFTYDPDAMTLTGNIEKEYAGTPTATTMSNGDYAAADYAYQDLKTLDGVDAETQTYTVDVLVTQDSLLSIYKKGSAANTWVSTSNMTTSSTTGSTVTTIMQDYTDTLTIVDGSFTHDDVYGQSMAVTGQATQTSTDEATLNYGIAQFFIVGEDTGDKTFSDVWKKDNTVTFQLTENQYTHIKYTGSTAPTAPTVDTSNGQGGTDSGTPIYFIDKNVNAYDMITGSFSAAFVFSSSVPAPWDLTNNGDYIVVAENTVSAGRNVAR